jgi:hypothetical protein
VAYSFTAASSQGLNTASTPVSGQPITLAAHCYPTTSATNMAVVSLANAVNAAGDYYQIELGGASAQVVRAIDRNAGGGLQAANSGTFSANQGYFLAAVFSTTSSRTAYNNGTAGTENTNSLPAPTNISAIGIGYGARTNPFGYLNGRVSECAIWNVALTSAEIDSLSKGFKPTRIRPQSLVFYAPLIRTAQDVRGGLAITNNNGATVADHPRVY